MWRLHAGTMPSWREVSTRGATPSLRSCTKNKLQETSKLECAAYCTEKKNEISIRLRNVYSARKKYIMRSLHEWEHILHSSSYRSACAAVELSDDFARTLKTCSCTSGDFPDPDLYKREPRIIATKISLRKASSSLSPAVAVDGFKIT